MSAASRRLAAFAIVLVLAGCSGPLPLFDRPAISREVVEADLRTKLSDSQVTTFSLEMQSIRWVDEHMPARFGEPLAFGQSGSGYEPDRRVWVAFIEGRLSQSIWPGGARTQSNPGKPRPPEAPPAQPDKPQTFSKALMLIDPESGGLIAMTAKPEP